ncbi:hypothetical protein [Marinilabilia rubra]|uniref:Uncharacterized protein n=1 Tax=Marinilabilia rubra TaxID=2162893 RepID=A0A2U2BD94_9BACT|nr:hypothetical protein [Marinilabilia rubra]PWE01046.1 hypothetical protein DDZ16_00730 [Marinilabilia rubra]
MDIHKKRQFIHSHLHQVKEPDVNEIYEKIVTSLNDRKIEESEEDIIEDRLTDHEELKKEIKNWRHSK